MGKCTTKKSSFDSMFDSKEMLAMGFHILILPVHLNWTTLFISLCLFDPTISSNSMQE